MEQSWALSSPVIRLWQSHMTFIFKNDQCVISIVSKSPPKAKTKIPLLYQSGMWGALKSEGILIFAWEKHPERESGADTGLCPGSCSLTFNTLNPLPLRPRGCSTGCACSPGMLWVCRSQLFWIWLSVISSSVTPIFSGICFGVKLIPSSSIFSVVKGP